jgi:hypothetical protein
MFGQLALLGAERHRRSGSGWPDARAPKASSPPRVALRQGLAFLNSAVSTLGC